jgi:Amt family ammonium transporter
MVGILIAVVLSGVGTFVLLKLVDLVIGLRMSPEEEMEGMDVTQHGEEGYDWA